MPVHAHVQAEPHPDRVWVCTLTGLEPHYPPHMEATASLLTVSWTLIVSVHLSPLPPLIHLVNNVTEPRTESFPSP